MSSDDRRARRRPWWWWVNVWLALARTERAYADALEIVHEQALEIVRLRSCARPDRPPGDE